MLFWLTVVTLILAGALACSTLILGKRPDAKALMDKLAPFEGIIGCVALGIGLWNLIDTIPNIGSVFKSVIGIIAFLGTLSLIGVGFLLAMSIIGKFLGPTGAAIASKLAPFKILMGIICIALGIFIPLNTYVLKLAF